MDDTEWCRQSVKRNNRRKSARWLLPTLVTGDPEMLVENIRTVVTARKRYAECERKVPHFLCPKPRTAGFLVETSQKWVNSSCIYMLNARPAHVL
jgi:hypothetical protein